MKLTCSNCFFKFNINENKFKGRKIKFPCPKCGNFIVLDLSNDSEQKETEKSISDKFENLLNNMDELPTLPIVVQRILQLINNPKSTIKQVGKIINSDQSLTAKTLKLVNSAYYGFEKRIKTVDQAIIIIGFDAVKNLALSASVFEMFKSVKQQSNFKREEFWLHAMGTAMAAKMISEDTSIGIPGELFVSGLIHDIGKIVLDSYFPKKMNNILYNASLKKISFIESEKEIMDMDHTMIGYKLARKWSLPDELVYPIRYHHKFEEGMKHEQIIAIVHIANVVVKIAKIGFDGDFSSPTFKYNAVNVIKKSKPDFNKSDIQKYVSDLKKQVKENDLINIALE